MAFPAVTPARWRCVAVPGPQTIQYGKRCMRHKEAVFEFKKPGAIRAREDHSWQCATTLDPPANARRFASISTENRKVAEPSIPACGNRHKCAQEGVIICNKIHWCDALYQNENGPRDTDLHPGQGQCRISRRLQSEARASHRWSLRPSSRRAL